MAREMTLKSEGGNGGKSGGCRMVNQSIAVGFGRGMGANYGLRLNVGSEGGSRIYPKDVVKI